MPPQPQQALQAQQAQQAQLVLQTQQHDLFWQLLEAAGSAAAAAAGLTPDLSASFMTLMDVLPAEMRAAREARLQTLLAQGMYTAAAQTMTTALALRVGPPPAGAP
ncbi:hypothetical protein ABPG77_011147 [Micractinium sp. CCAP 211/92]